MGRRDSIRESELNNKKGLFKRNKKDEVKSEEPTEEHIEEIKKEDEVQNRDANVESYNADNTSSIENTKEDNKEEENNKLVKIEHKLHAKDVMVYLLMTILVVMSIGNLAYTISKSSEVVNQLATILGTTALTIFVVLFVIVSIVDKKEKAFTKIFSFVLLMGFVGFNLFNQTGMLKLPVQETVKNFTNIPIEEVTKWAETQNIEIEQAMEYSDTVPMYNIIAQDVDSGTLAKNVTKIKVIVSEGPDPNKSVIVPTMYGWTTDEVIEFVNDNFMSNVDVEFITSDETKNTVIEQSAKGEITRSTQIKLTFSRGSEDSIVPTQMVDLSGKSLFEATMWLKMNGFEFTVTKEFSDDVEFGKVMSQDKEIGAIVDPRNEKISIVISRGKRIVTPDLMNMTVQEITKWVIDNKLKLVYDDRYDDAIEAGKIISADRKQGDELQMGDKISIVVSKGQLKMEEFDDYNKFKEWAAKYGVQYEEQKENSDTIEDGKIIRFSIEKGQIIKTGDKVIVYISKGPQVEVPNFVGMSRNQIVSKCNDLGLRYTFRYGGFSNTVGYDIATNQSISTGEKVDKGILITFTLSKGAGVTIPNFSGKNKGEISSTCSNLGIKVSFVSGSYGSTSKDCATSQGISAGSVVDKGTIITVVLSLGPAQTFTLNINEYWLGRSFDETKNMLSSQFATNYPGVNFTYEGVSHNTLAAGFIPPDSPTKDGSRVTQGQTYRIYIVK